MNVDSEKMELNVENTNIEMEIGNNDVEIEENVLRVFEKEHSKLKNLDFESSGHTGFQPAGNYVEDKNYVHTDNNFTDEAKYKLNNLENFSGNSNDVVYLDSNVESTLTNIIDSMGNLDELQTVSKDTLVGAINETLAKGGIPELVNASIDVMKYDPGIYIVSGANTQLRRGTTTLVTRPIITPSAKGILILTRYVNGFEEGLFFQPTTTKLVSVWVFSSTTCYQKSFMNLLSTNNTQSYEPTGYYNPAHKGYVDGKFAGEDLGYIDLDEYDGSPFVFMETLTEVGKYTFMDSYDEFVWFVEVHRWGDYSLGQTYWGDEEGYAARYYRAGYYDEVEDVYYWDEWTSYLTSGSAKSMFKGKNEVDYVTETVEDLRTWLDEMGSFGIREYEVIQTSNNHKFMVNTRYTNYKSGTAWNYVRYQEYYDIEEPNKIYRRTGKQTGTSASSEVIWGDWYVFEGIAE